MNSLGNKESPRNSPSNWLVVTDLDGTLLDHHSYSYQPAVPALGALGARNIPVILCSSKTRAEMVQIRRDLNNHAPFVVENGAAVCWDTPASGADSGEADLELGRSYRDIIDILAQIRSEESYQFRGFNDLSIDQVADITGLSREQAALAKDREYSEPLIWDDSLKNRETFLQQLAGHQLCAQQGGRFLTVSGLTDKGRAVEVLRKVYSQERAVRIIVLGDSPNDRAMLEAADIAVIVNSANAEKLVVEQPDMIIRTEEYGPRGWNDAILAILEEVENG